ncbi:MAG: UDP-N-acetylmuramate dehydrogenase, partial [Culicoidibacterales bacterium]
SEDGLVKTLKAIHSQGKAFKVIGKGSNLLPSDDIYNGVIIYCDKGLDYLEINSDTGVVRVGAGYSLIKLAIDVAKKGLTGFEFASGIPGNIGGAVFMNAGIKQNEMKDCISRVKIVRGSGDVMWLDNREMEFGYRKSILQEHRDWICTEVEIQLQQGDKEEITKQIQHLREIRQKGQPLSLPNCGSVFRNPLPHYAGQLIEDVGLKGFSIGGAKVSDVHANFIVNTGDATAENVMHLIEHIRSVVFEKHGVHLHLEVETFNW